MEIQFKECAIVYMTEIATLHVYDTIVLFTRMQ